MTMETLTLIALNRAAFERSRPKIPHVNLREKAEKDRWMDSLAKRGSAREIRAIFRGSLPRCLRLVCYATSKKNHRGYPEHGTHFSMERAVKFIQGRTTIEFQPWMTTV